MSARASPSPSSPHDTGRREIYQTETCRCGPSFVIEAPGGRVYFVADSGYGSGSHFRKARERHGPFKLAVLPIGAYEPRWFMRDQHMNPGESVQAFIDFRCRVRPSPSLWNLPAHGRTDRRAAHRSC